MKSLSFSEIWKYLLLCCILLILYIFLTPKQAFEFDTYCWKLWTTNIFNSGFKHTYEKSSDYLPIYHYILYIFSKTQNSIDDIHRHIHYLKFYTVIFQFIAGYYLLVILKHYLRSFNMALFLSIFYLGNIAILYNSLIWGQIDSIFTCFIFIAFFYAYNKKIILTIIFLILALNVKPQSIIFVPLLGLVILPEIICSFSFKKLILWISIAIGLEILIMSPFIINGTIFNLWIHAMHPVKKFPHISVNAYNVWEIIIQGDLRSMKDDIQFLGLSYRLWGMITFFFSSFITLFPLISHCIQSIQNKNSKPFAFDKLLLIFGLIPLLFFYCNTEMHERYSHPAIIFLVLYSLLYKKFSPTSLICLAYILNLERVLHFLPIKQEHNILFNNNFISCIYLIAILWFFIFLYDLKSKKIIHHFYEKRVIGNHSHL